MKTHVLALVVVMLLVAQPVVAQTAAAPKIASVQTATSTQNTAKWSTGKKIIVSLAAACVVAAAVAVPVAVGVHVHQQHVHHLHRLAYNKLLNTLVAQQREAPLLQQERLIEARLQQGHLTPQQIATMENELGTLHAEEQEVLLAPLLPASHGTPGTGIMFGPYLDSATEQMRSQI